MERSSDAAQLSRHGCVLENADWQIKLPFKHHLLARLPNGSFHFYKHHFKTARTPVGAPRSADSSVGLVVGNFECHQSLKHESINADPWNELMVKHQPSQWGEIWTNFKKLKDKTAILSSLYANHNIMLKHSASNSMRLLATVAIMLQQPIKQCRFVA